MEKLYEELLKKYDGRLFEFCISNNNKNFRFIPLDGKVIKIDNQYVLRTHSLRSNKEEYDDFALNEPYDTVKEKEHELMVRNPQHIYMNLLLKDDIYDVLIIYSKKPDNIAVKELDRLTFLEYLKFIDIKSEDDFIRMVRKCLSIYKKDHPNTNMTLDEILNFKYEN